MRPIQMDNPPPACPRCGYDQRGEIAQWVEACPTTGVCTECGLEIQWREVLNPRVSEPRWCVEFVDLEDRDFTGQVRWLMSSLIWTLAHSLWPWHFWSRIRMSHAIRWNRIAIYIGFLVFVLLPLYATWQGGLAAARRYQIGRDVIAVNKTYAEAIREAILHPMQQHSVGSVVDAGWTYGYPPPTDLYDYGFVSEILPFTVLGLLGPSPFPIVFLFLPITRKRAKIRWGHISRGWAYSAIVPLLTLAGTAMLLIAAEWTALFRLLHYGLGLAGVWLLAMLYWWAVLRCYLKIPHALFTAAMLMGLLLLLGLGLLMIFGFGPTLGGLLV